VHAHRGDIQSARARSEEPHHGSGCRLTPTPPSRPARADPGPPRRRAHRADCCPRVTIGHTLEQRLVATSAGAGLELNASAPSTPSPPACDEIGSVASYTSTYRSHDVTGFSAPTRQSTTASGGTQTTPRCRGPPGTDATSSATQRSADHHRRRSPAPGRIDPSVPATPPPLRYNHSGQARSLSQWACCR
jgi:hypothetical protein